VARLGPMDGSPPTRAMALSYFLSSRKGVPVEKTGEGDLHRGLRTSYEAREMPGQLAFARRPKPWYSLAVGQ